MTSRLSDDWSHFDQSADLERHMKAIELREALDLWESDHAPLPNSPIVNALSLGHAVEFQPIIDAARTIALPILEADPELVERIRLAIGSVIEGITDHSAPAIWNATVEEAANEVLAAISTPTPGES